MKTTEFPKAMIIAFTILVAILLAEGIFVFTKGTQKDAVPAQAEEVASVSPLHVEGTALVNANGEKVKFKGISLGWHNLWPRFYNAGAIESLHNDWGSNCFRLAIGADDLHEDLNGTTDHPGYMSDPDGSLACLFAAADAAIANNCYVIVDWHSHLTHLDAAKDFFTKVAERYKGVPNVIYELFNEPVSRAFETKHDYSDLGDNEALTEYWKDLKAYAEELISTITAIDNSNPVILMGCPSWDQRIDFPAADPITSYGNIMYTMHFYAATHGAWLRDATDAAMKAGLPVFISECAATEASGDGFIDVEAWETYCSWADNNGLSMMAWSVSDKNESCSMFTKEATSEGPWGDEVIKQWGKMVKEWINK